MNTRILVWDLPVRIFHWTFAATFVIAYLSAETERYRDIHVLSGYLMLALIGFRLIWGLVGSRHARFSDFVRGPTAVLHYLRSLFSARPERHLGHNPAGAVAILLLLVLSLGTGLTGWMTLNEIGGEALKELHEGFSNATLIMVAIHLIGVIVSSLLHRENLVLAMISGRKSGPTEKGIPRAHGIMAAVLIAAIAAFGWGMAQGKLPVLMGPATMASHTQEHHDRQRGD